MEIELANLTKNYGSAQIVNGLSFALDKGEMIALLGPSGCGKTTTLRMVAGFTAPTSGSIRLRGIDITGLPAHRRDCGLVFQNYALFPHMSVADNILFGLRRRKITRPERQRRLTEILDLMQLTGFDDRFPDQLSGGQQQRVAVARALVINPTILLLDEPFSNLDAKLRETTGIELRRIQKTLGLTSIFVTHDQSEAMSIADRIAVMNGGVIEQIGSAREIYTHPRTRFIAEFIGRANFLPAIVSDAKTVRVRLVAAPEHEIVLGDQHLPDRDTEIELLVRPETVRLTPEKRKGAFSVQVRDVSYQGSTAYVHTVLADGNTVLLAECDGAESAVMSPGATLFASIDEQTARYIPPAG